MHNYGECEWETGVVLYEHKEKKKKKKFPPRSVAVKEMERNEKNIFLKKIKR